MSGTGKSSALRELEQRGIRVVDTDEGEWCEWREDGWFWREDAMHALLSEPLDRPLVVAGCVTNQGAFYDRFDAVVLLSAPADVLLDRLARRTTNDYGKAPDERALVLQHLATVEPLLRRTCTHQLDASAPLDAVVAGLEAIATDTVVSP
jgi:hypothetical protein